MFLFVVISLLYIERLFSFKFISSGFMFLSMYSIYMLAFFCMERLSLIDWLYRVCRVFMVMLFNLAYITYI